MSWGNKTTTQQQSQQQNSSMYNNMQSSTPNLSPQVQGLNNQNIGYASNMMAEAQQPVFGDAQIASYMQGLNSIANNATQTLNSNLASHGINNSGAYAAGATGIQQNLMGQESGFFGQLPFMQQQAMLANQGNALNASTNVARSIPYGSTSTQTGTSSGNQSGTSNSTQTQDPGMAGLIAALGGAALGGGGGSSLMNMMGLGSANSNQVGNLNTSLNGSIYNPQGGGVANPGNNISDLTNTLAPQSVPAPAAPSDPFNLFGNGQSGFAGIGMNGWNAGYDPNAWMNGNFG